jgi:hypothetical protein
LVKLPSEQIQTVMQGIRKGPNGPNAVDNIQAGVMQHLIEGSIDPSTDVFNPSTFVKELGTPSGRRQYQELLGPRFDNAMKFRTALQNAGLKTYGGSPGAVGFSTAYHALQGGVAISTGRLGGAAYHLGTMGLMVIAPATFQRLLNNRVGRNLLAAGVLEKAGTPRAGVIVDKLAKVVDDLGGQGVKQLAPPPQGQIPQGPFYQGPPFPQQ